MAIAMDYGGEELFEDEDGIKVPLVLDQKSNFQVLHDHSDVRLASNINKKFLGIKEVAGSSYEISAVNKSALISKQLLNNIDFHSNVIGESLWQFKASALRPSENSSSQVVSATNQQRFGFFRSKLALANSNLKLRAGMPGNALD